MLLDGEIDNAADWHRVLLEMTSATRDFSRKQLSACNAIFIQARERSGDSRQVRNVAIALVLVGAAAASAQAGPIGVVSAIGGWDSSAPGHEDDGFLGGFGYQIDRVSALVQYKRLGASGGEEYDGGAQGVDLVLQGRLFAFHNRGQLTHIDANLIIGQQWVTWHAQPQGIGLFGLPPPDTVYSGREVGIGVSATFFFRFALEYLVFNDGTEAGTGLACRGTCIAPSQPAVHGDDHAVMLEIGMAFGDR